MSISHANDGARVGRSDRVKREGTRMMRMRSWMETHPWLWSFLGACIVFLVTVPTLHGRGMAQSIQVALQFATFYVMVGLGQMLVITLGNGNIDLSIPGVITLGGYFGLGVAHNAIGGLAGALGVGIAAGLVNIVLVLYCSGFRR